MSITNSDFFLFYVCAPYDPGLSSEVRTLKIHETQTIVMKTDQSCLLGNGVTVAQQTLDLLV